MLDSLYFDSAIGADRNQTEWRNQAQCREAGAKSLGGRGMARRGRGSLASGLLESFDHVNVVRMRVDGCLVRRTSGLKALAQVEADGGTGRWRGDVEFANARLLCRLLGFEEEGFGDAAEPVFSAHVQGDNLIGVWRHAPFEHDEASEPVAIECSECHCARLHFLSPRLEMAFPKLGIASHGQGVVVSFQFSVSLSVHSVDGFGPIDFIDALQVFEAQLSDLERKHSDWGREQMEGIDCLQED